MLTHLVLARWKAGTTDETIAQIAEKAQILRGIEGVVDVVLHANLGTALPAFGKGIGSILIVTMQDRATLDRYGPHPLHAELGSVLLPNAEELTIVDYVSPADGQG